ncbi:relaxase/mobilization nuclease domain-containing protein [Helicobacter sp. MIT 21-1697]|uniref:relaxase/mobilization nuclease domain-containing protein n=1 Tax=Helicobacter sp. MIT 21-1697 TaxID=2993733 RepID=UPI00224AD1DC|nr:relaxase/mobilization nuclease domain-containing protein [Helicobacter sp. MIT 21-1697]MCX2716812.1 relaxase/mobilization nuclease domain-containing protein [Helicobacter sp. MIT 21-1697]
MRDVILELPPENSYEQSELFEYISFKKIRKIPEHYPIKIKRAFRTNFERNVALFSPQKNPHQSSSKNVVIKNIGNMKKAHLCNALSYTFSHSELQVGFNHLGECVNAGEILEDWGQDFSSNPKTNEAMHLVFSLNEPHSQSVLDTLLESTRQTMQSYFSEYKWVLVPHSHQNKPHIHIIVNKSNMFSGKKLHFKSKGEISHFFEELREDFKYNLFEYSRGKLDYTNEVKFDKKFRQDMLSSKIEKLEQLNLIAPAQKEIDFMASYKEAITDVNQRLNGLDMRAKNTKKSLHNNTNHLKNIQSKIAQREEQGLNVALLLERARIVQEKLDKDKRDIDEIELRKSELENYMRHFLNWEENFSNFTKNFQTQQKQKAFLKSFKGFERYLSIELNTKLRDIQRSILHNEKLMQESFKNINEGMLASLSDMKPKSNVFVLKKQYSKLLFYKGIVSSIEFENNANLRDKKAQSIKELSALQAQIVNMLKEQANQLPRSVKTTLQEIENLKSNTSLNDIELAKAYVRYTKRLSFYEKSIKALQGFQKQYGIDFKLESELKGAQDILKQTEITEQNNINAPQEAKQIALDNQSIKVTNKSVPEAVHTKIGERTKT